jgi:hypothetical protein
MTQAQTCPAVPGLRALRKCLVPHAARGIRRAHGCAFLCALSWRRTP